VTLSRRIGAQTGGVGASFSPFLRLVPGRISGPDDVILKFMIRGKAVVDKLGPLYEIIRDLALDAKLDNRKRVLELLREAKIRYESALVSSGNSFAATRLGAQHSMIGFLSELTGGVSYYQMLPELIAEAEHNWSAFLARLEGIRQVIISRDRMLINLTGDDRTLTAARHHAEEFVNSIPERPSTHDVLKTWSPKRLLPRKDEGLIVPTQVNYVVRAGRLYQPGEPVSGSTAVVSRFLGRGFLWDHVRVIGGAYGGSCRFAAGSGMFTFSSYRDPNLVKTLQTYDAAAEHLLTVPIPEEELHQAIIGTVGDLDVPQSPDQKGYASMTRYIINQSDEDRQQWRDEVLSTTERDFREFGERLKSLNSKIATCVVGSRAALEEANQQLDKHRAMELVSVLGSSSAAAAVVEEEIEP
jgi:Zn-dependent M16 (insulinase) family peptidase